MTAVPLPTELPGTTAVVVPEPDIRAMLRGLGVYDPDDLDDLIQEVRLRAERRGRSDGAFIRGIAVKVVLEYRRFQRKRACEVSLVGSEDNELVDVEDFRAGAFMQEVELREIVEQIRKLLTPTQRSVIDGVYVDDLSYRELAKRLATSEANIRQIHHRAMRILRSANILIGIGQPGPEGAGPGGRR